MLKGKDIVLGYGERNEIFSSISFSANNGDLIALLGVNGIGKSTLLRTIAGLQNKLSGQLDFDGREITSISAANRARLISVVLTERIFIDNIAVQDFIALGRAPYTGWLGNLTDDDNREIEKVISLMKVEKLRKRLFNQLSDGEKQKTLIARALCQQTPVMILDEPNAFLDFRNKKDVLDLLKSICSELNKIIVFSTHDVEASLEYCNKFWLMTEDKKFMEIEKGANYREEVLK